MDLKYARVRMNGRDKLDALEVKSYVRSDQNENLAERGSETQSHCERKAVRTCAANKRRAVD